MIDYRSWIAGSVPRPTEQQMRAIATFLSIDHSWYKKLPLRGPGEPFFCYIAPHMHQIYIDSSAGVGGWRDIVTNEESTWLGDTLRISFEPGDVEPELGQSLTQIAHGRATAEVWASRSRFSYWNYGPPAQPLPEALSQAKAQLRLADDQGNPVAIPRVGLAAGLVYLRGTVSPMLGPEEDRYDQLRSEYDLPSHTEGRLVQLNAIVSALQAFTQWV